MSRGARRWMVSLPCLLLAALAVILAVPQRGHRPGSLRVDPRRCQGRVGRCRPGRHGRGRQQRYRPDAPGRDRRGGSLQLRRPCLRASTASRPASRASRRSSRPRSRSPSTASRASTSRSRSARWATPSPSPPSRRSCRPTPPRSTQPARRGDDEPARCRWAGTTSRCTACCPASRRPANSHSIPTNPSRSLEFTVNGTSDDQNNTRIDGVSTANIQLPHVVLLRADARVDRGGQRRHQQHGRGAGARRRGRDQRADPERIQCLPRVRRSSTSPTRI